VFQKIFNVVYSFDGGNIFVADGTAKPETQRLLDYILTWLKTCAYDFAVIISEM
jgi:hypothetical protein